MEINSSPQSLDTAMNIVQTHTFLPFQGFLQIKTYAILIVFEGYLSCESDRVMLIFLGDPYLTELIMSSASTLYKAISTFSTKG